MASGEAPTLSHALSTLSLQGPESRALQSPTCAAMATFSFGQSALASRSPCPKLADTSPCLQGHPLLPLLPRRNLQPSVSEHMPISPVDRAPAHRVRSLPQASEEEHPSLDPQQPHQQQHQGLHPCSEPHRLHRPRQPVSLAQVLPLPRPADGLDRPRPLNRRPEDSLVQEQDKHNNSSSNRRPRNCLGSLNPLRPLRSLEEETRSPPLWPPLQLRPQSRNSATRSLPRRTNRASNPASSPSRKRGTRPRRRNAASRRTSTTSSPRGRVRPCIADRSRARGGTSGTARRGRTPIQRGAFLSLGMSPDLDH